LILKILRGFTIVINDNYLKVSLKLILINLQPKMNQNPKLPNYQLKKRYHFFFFLSYF